MPLVTTSAGTREATGEVQSGFAHIPPRAYVRTEALVTGRDTLLGWDCMRCPNSCPGDDLSFQEGTADSPGALAPSNSPGSEPSALPAAPACPAPQRGPEPTTDPEEERFRDPAEGMPPPGHPLSALCLAAFVGGCPTGLTVP